MAGTAKSYDGTKIIIGPADVWLNVALPATGSRLTVAADLTPDATANPNAIHLGMTKSGTVFEIKPEVQNFGSDELTGFHRSRLVAEVATIKGDFLEVFDFNILEKMTLGATKTINTSTTSGYHEIAGGGLSTIATYPIAIIGPDIETPTLYWVIQLYRSFNKSGLAFNVTRKEQSSSPFEFEGQSVTTRPAGDQIYKYHKSLVVGV